MNRETKKGVFLITAIAVLLVMASCSKPKEEAPAESSAPEIIEEKPTGYVLLHNLALWSYDGTKEKDQWGFIQSLPLGKRVEILQKTPIVLKKDNRENEWLQIRYGDKEGYALKLYIGTYDTLAVVISEEAMRFKTPEITSVLTGNPLPRGTILVIPSDDKKADFCRAHAVNPEGIVFTDFFIKQSDISYREADTQAFILYRISKSVGNLEKEKDPKARANIIKARVEILNEALTKYGESVFSPQIQEEISYLTTVDKKKGKISQEIVSATVYEKPNVTAPTIATLQTGTEVTIVEKTTVEGLPWVRIIEPYGGWIQGQYISEE
ncbi:MAG: SH3 domain-containing protein [Treponemataceae bacterium]|nr:SH3 domain-containing protein [Treponemataceae bacterium]